MNRSTRTARLAFAVAAFAFACAGASGETLANDALRLTFAAAEDGFGLAAVENLLTGGTRYVFPPADGARAAADFWRLRFTRNGLGGFTLTNRSPARRRLVRDGDETRFFWEGLSLPNGETNAVDVIASVTLPRGAAASDWRIRVVNRSTVWGLEETVYPCFRGIVRPGETDALLPHAGLGARLVRNFDCKSRTRVCYWGEYAYPSYFPARTAFLRDGGGISLSADDPDARIKTLWVNDGNVEFRTPVENAGCAGRAAEGPGYAVRLEAFRGDWWAVARLHRNWALRQKWTAKGPLARRTDYPATMSQPSFWYCRYMYDAQRFRQFFEKIHAEAPDVRLGIRWYRWHSGDMDTNFPEFLPALDHVGETGEALVRLGYSVMPYINARLWDTKLMSYDYARKDVCVMTNGVPFTELWRGKPYGRHAFGIMCPHARDWQNLLQRLAEESLAQTKCNALYYDQVGCALPCACRNPAHGHPVGGGRWWADAYRTILARAHDAFAPKGIAMTTEGTAECYMDVCDGFLATSVPTREDVPFYPAVYSDYTTYFSTRFSVKEPFARAFPLMAREFTWGFANGWSDDWRERKALDPRTIDAALAFARARQTLADYLAFGRLEDELRPLDALPTVPVTTWEAVHAFEYPVAGELPVVLGNCWRTVEGTRRALIAVNVSDAPQTVRVREPAPSRTRLAGSGCRAQAQADTLTLELAPRQILALEWDLKGNTK